MHVVLYEPEIHWNTGNIGRTCLATGSKLHLIEPLGFSLSDREVRRAGLDYWERVSVKLWPDWPAFEEALPALGKACFLSTKAERSLWEVDLTEVEVLIFGPETRGLPDAILRRYEPNLARIPIDTSEVRSLNLSTAAAVALFEALRQKQDCHPERSEGSRTS